MKIRKPIKPTEPQKVWEKSYTKHIPVVISNDDDTDECDPESTVLYFSDLISLREKIDIPIPDNKLQLVINTDKTTDYSYVNNAYFHYEYEEENPNYEKEMETYKRKLKTYDKWLQDYNVQVNKSLEEERENKIKELERQIGLLLKEKSLGK